MGTEGNSMIKWRDERKRSQALQNNLVTQQLKQCIFICCMTVANFLCGNSES